MLTSARNPKVASAVRLRKRALREIDRRFLVEGAQAVTRGARRGHARDAVHRPTTLDPLAVRAGRSGVETHHVADDVVRRLTPRSPRRRSSASPPSSTSGSSAALSAALRPDEGCVALLHEVRDPGNAGTVLRSADAAGAGAVVFSETSVDVYNPKTVRASAGSIFHLPVVRGAGTLEPIARARGAGRPRAGHVGARAPSTCTGPTSRGRSCSCSATRRTACPTTSWRAPTRACGCPSPAGRSR